MIHAGYSFRAAFGHLPDVLSRLQEIGWKTAPIADRCSTFGFTRWTKACAKFGMRPVFGVELGVVPALGEKQPSPDYFTFLALNDIADLHALISLATGNPGREPSLTYAQALNAHGVVRITGERCQLELLGDRPINTFIGLSPATPKGLLNVALKAKLPVVAIPNNRFPRTADRELYRVALGRNADAQSYPQWITSDQEWREAVGWMAGKDVQRKALAAREAILKRCKATLKKATLLSPEKPKTLEQMCREGAKRLGIKLEDSIYAERLERELRLIKEKNFSDYFYIIADLVNWAKQRMVVGPARGSSCGSLVCYLLGITAIDPIPFSLLFERFIDASRADLPDVDLDFSDTNRHLVFEYAEQKYGSERVARLGTVGMFKPRSALNQVGKELRVPRWMTDKVAENIILHAAGDERANKQLEDTFVDTGAGREMMSKYPEMAITAKLEGHPANASQHAAGIVITEHPVNEYVAVDARTKSTMCDKKDAEDLGLLKIDALGLTQLSIFERTLELIGQQPVSGWLEKLSLDDPAAFNVLNQEHFAGIFQFMGGALKALTRQIKVESLEDMIAITALARPGVASAASWAKRRMGTEREPELHPLFARIVGSTHGIVIYQEQVMQVVREIGGFSWEDVSGVRKAIAKSMGGEVISGYMHNFLDGAIRNGLEPDVARSIWNQISAMGGYAFNKAHAVAYAHVSYYCCVLKAHYPLEFAAATLDAESDPARQIELLRELAEEGIGYVAIDPDRSTERWAPATGDEQRYLVGPLTNIKGIGPAAVQEILDARKHGKELRPVLAKRLKAAKTEIDTLYPVADRINRLHPDLSALNIVSTPTPVKKVQCGLRGDVMILAVARKIASINENEPQRVERRDGRVMTGPTQALNLFLQDDTDEIFCKIDRYKFDQIGREILERGRAGKALYALKGTVPSSFRMISVTGVRYLGDLTDDALPSTEGRENVLDARTSEPDGDDDQ